MLRWLAANGCPVVKSCWNAAAQRGHLHVLQWAWDNGYVGKQNAKDIISEATTAGHLKILQMMHARGCELTSLVCAEASAQGYFEILRWAVKNNFPWDHEVCYWAAVFGRLDILCWARKNNCPWEAYKCIKLALMHLTLSSSTFSYTTLSWLRTVAKEHGYQFPSHTSRWLDQIDVALDSTGMCPDEQGLVKEFITK